MRKLDKELSDVNEELIKVLNDQIKIQDKYIEFLKAEIVELNKKLKKWKTHLKNKIIKAINYQKK